jgi:hypothetical protein
LEERQPRPPVAADLQAALECLDDLALVHDSLLRCYAADRPQELALALFARAADASAVKSVAELIAYIGKDGGPLLQRVSQLIREDLKEIAGDAPPESAHGTVVLAAELFNRGLQGMASLKEVFAALLFGRQHPPDHAVMLACHAFMTAGPFLDRSEVGSKMVAYLVLRLKEVKGGNLTAVTRQGITDVVELRNHKWVMIVRSQAKNRSPDQRAAVPPKKARRQRVLALLDRFQAGEHPMSLWPDDADVQLAMVQLAASGPDPGSAQLELQAPVFERALGLLQAWVEGGRREELVAHSEALAVGPGRAGLSHDPAFLTVLYSGM